MQQYFLATKLNKDTSKSDEIVPQLMTLNCNALLMLVNFL